MRKWFVLLCLLFPLLHLVGVEDQSKHILLMTLPKSGTHLLRKAVSLISKQKTDWIGLQTKRFDPEAHLRKKKAITGAHIFPLFDQIRLGYLDRFTTVLMIRDPRDVMLSFCSHLRRALFWTSCPKFDLDRFLTLPPEEQLRETLTFPEEYLNPSVCFPYVELWMNEPSVYVCRYEDLVGAKGGGSDERQFQVLTELANHIGFPRTAEEIEQIASQLYGGTWTFDVGKIGRWESGYEPANEQLFMQLYGRYIAAWGY